MKPQGQYLKLFTMNGKSIKLWKIFDKTQKRTVKAFGGKDLAFPKHTIIGSTPSVSLQYRNFYKENNIEKIVKKNLFNLIFQTTNNFCFLAIQTR